MNVIFLFSTKYIEDSTKYVFSQRTSLPKESKILKYRKECLDSKGYLDSEKVKRYLDSIIEEQRQDFLKKVNFTLEDYKKDCDLISIDISSQHSLEFALEKYPHIADYYVPKDSKNINVFAVKCLEGKADVQWINALIQDETIGGGKLQQGDILYLILHDKDVPGKEGKTFEILSPSDVKSIRGINIEVAFEIRVIIFNHENKTITSILENTLLSSTDVANKTKSIFVSTELLEQIFCGNTQNFSILYVDGLVDIMDKKYDKNKLTKKPLSSKRVYYEYEDNGALLTELMHVRIDIKAAENFKELVEGIMSNETENAPHSPVIIKIYKSFFDDWANAVSFPKDKEKILNHPNKKAMEENLERAFTFFNNSSIWVRLVDINNENAYDTAVAEFVYFDKIGLYDYVSAWENLEYNLRIFSQNYLESSLDGHGNFVTPLLYGKEKEALKVMKENYVEIKDKVFYGHELKLIKQHYSVKVRILLIDDKLGPKESADKYIPLIIDSDNDKFASICTKECSDEECKNCNRSECKLRTLKQLMDDGYKNPEKKDVFTGIGDERIYFYWKETDIKTFYCPTIINDFIDDDSIDLSNYEGGINVFTASDNPDPNIKKQEDESKKIDNALNIKCEFTPQINSKNLNVQIVGVRDVRTALLLMSKYKFDMIFCDYLLDKKENGSEEREYSNQLFDFLSHDYKNEIENEEKDNPIRNGKINRLKVLNQLRRDVFDNRGPLDKLWIIPSTGFNQTFIQDLYCNKIDLIGHKWNISNGADPITTPWQFLYHFNKFIELQLKQCVSDMSHLLRFLLYTCEDLGDKMMRNKRRSSFYSFQAFMGSEYANFMRRYGNRHVIQRDAYKDNSDEKTEKSIFATYIWKEFYANPQNRDVIELNRLIQRFLYQAATMHNDREGQQRLEESFSQMCNFIDINKEARKAISQTTELNEKLESSLNKLREMMDDLTSN